jgi:pilus assembly protein CpaC
MYSTLSRRSGLRLVLAAVMFAQSTLFARPAMAQQPSSVVRNLSQANERLEMTVNTSQILTLGTRIPRMVVNNPDLVTATPISETQVQIAARKPGVTQINLWDENGEIYTVDLLIFGDVRELEVNLQRMFPSSSLRVIRLTNSLVLEGQVDRPEIVSTIRQLAEDYAPKVVNNITVGGAQQIMLKVKVMEVNRTNLRALGFDFNLSGTGGFLTQSASGVLTSIDNVEGVFTAPSSTITFDIIDGNTSFLGTLEALQQRKLVKTLANPTLITVSGRPAAFNAGGEIFFQINNGISGSTVESEDFGTQLDFLPIVMGNGRIRLEVRPKISEIDNSVPLGNELFRTKVSYVDTGVEMQAGQTLALAGLKQTRERNEVRGVPYLMDVPYVGAAFRKAKTEVEEIELLILVTPEFAEAMEPHEVPMCGPGMETMSPSNCELYWKGLIEVPACGPCGANDPCYCNAPGLDCNVNGQGPCGGPAGGTPAYVTDGQMPAGQAYRGQHYQRQPYEGEVYQGPRQTNPRGPAAAQPLQPQLAPATLPDPAAQLRSQTASPVVHHSPVNRRNPNPVRQASGRTTSTPGLIGPIGYDVQK